MSTVGRLVIPWQLTGLRNGEWLQDQTEKIWSQRFPDMPRKNDVDVSFAESWKSRLGVISLSVDGSTSYIGINSLLSLPEAPDCIARITLAHEMVHYLHGFGSSLPRRHRSPHRGRIVEKELFARGFYDEYQIYEEWIAESWFDFYERCALNPAVVTKRPPAMKTRETYESQ